MSRTLVKKTIARAKQRRADQDNGNPPDDKLPPGHMRLYSFYTPSLEAGPYAIEAKQTVTATGSPDLHIWNYLGNSTTPATTIQRQKFEVAAPQFTIDPKTINTCYPPQGHADEGRILPHIVFNDPHMPWLRRAGITYHFLKQPFNPPSATPAAGPAPTPDANPHSMVPWMAVVVFSPDELLVSQTEATAIGLDKIQLASQNVYTSTKLPANGAFSMTVKDYLGKLQNNRIYYEAADTSEISSSPEVTSVIFPTKLLLQQIFGDKTQPHVLQGHRLLAHVRHINTIGFPDAGVEEEGYFSVVVSSRTGEVQNNVPTTQIVHLVSLEHYDSTLNLPHSPFLKLADTDRVGMVSLYSWTYTCIPEAVSFVDMMTNLAQAKQPLRPPDAVLTALQTNAAKQPTLALQKASAMLHDRLQQSYTISRWRTPSGEQSAAFTRGPLVASPTPGVPASNFDTWPVLSMTGKDYQIFDTATGIMDLTYSSAWSFGRVAAISDSPFNAALLRFRSLVSRKATSTTRMLTNGIATRHQVLSETARALSKASEIKAGTFSGPVARATPPSTMVVAAPLTDPKIQPVFKHALHNVIDNMTSTTDGEQIYSDYSLDTAANSDWELIHAWLSDTLYLKNIPDPSHINAAPVTDHQPPLPNAPPTDGQPQLPNAPPEALRFFYIDHSWLDAFIDGALSCANHLEPKYDSTRMRIKDAYNFYLSKPIHGLEKKVPPVPRYGFIIRSSAVKATPDLKITVFCWAWDATTSTFSPDIDEKTRRNPVVQLTKMDDSTILCLLDCLPEEIFEIRIAQPPHQQRFAMGDAIVEVGGKLQAELQVRMLYTSSDTTGTKEDGTWPFLTMPADEASYFKPETRMIQPEAIVNSIERALLTTTKYPGLYTDKITNSCILGIELNDACYTLIIKGDKPTRTKDFETWVRELWTGPDPALPHNSITKAVLSKSFVAPPPAEKVKAAPKPAGSTKIQPPAVPAAPLLHSSTTIPQPSPPKSVIARPLAASGAPSLIQPQFRLIVHVDYRPPPPTPLMMDGSPIYAPMDYLPTKSAILYDLILAVRRKFPNSNTVQRLSQLDIELPISDGTDSADIHKQIREPLLPQGGYKGPGVRMASNIRFVPTQTSGTDKEGKPVLVITLIPRSGRKDATILVQNDGRTDEASVRLAQCPIAPIKNPNMRVTVAKKAGGGTEPGKLGVCKLVLRETYTLPNGETRVVQTDGNLDPDGGSAFPPCVALKSPVST
ncbi:hypothetical protein H2200_008181 [Cladophialophora chaetospira]|uniref:Uncharacterized protein n=1 Tax=Cladophialophora chaetospira TaxID=386627 RepID=A0AA38X5N2_9EURO|nr:hypothetical protein H2200_008181 [Cladophialophora chaetospira]